MHFHTYEDWHHHYIDKICKLIDYDIQPPFHIWTGSVKICKGAIYGRFHYTEYGTGKYMDKLVHRAMYIIGHHLITLEPNLDDFGHPYDVSHRCHNKLCINLSHLSLEPRAINNNRNICKNEKKCTQDHEGYANCIF